MTDDGPELADALTTEKPEVVKELQTALRAAVALLKPHTTNKVEAFSIALAELALVREVDGGAGLITQGPERNDVWREE